MASNDPVSHSILYLRKADENLSDAEAALRSGRHNASASRSYYAAFQAAVAALWEAGVRPTRMVEGTLSHSAVQAEWSGRLIYRRKLYPPEMRRVLPKLLELRVTGDYRTRDVTAREAQKAASLGAELVRHVQARLAVPNSGSEGNDGGSL